MIKPSDIHVEQNYGETFRGREIRAILKATVLRRCPDNPDEIRRSTQLCKREIWHGLYGDVYHKLQEARQRVLYNVASAAGPAFSYSALTDAGKAIDEVLSMIADPFSGAALEKQA